MRAYSALLLLTCWGGLLTGLLWFRAVRLYGKSAPPPMTPPATPPPDLSREETPPLRRLLLLVPLCLWLIAGGTTLPRQSWAGLATISALGLILLVITCYLSAGANDADD